MIIIDTDVLIEIFDKQSIKGDLALKKIEDTGEEIAITSLSLHEILYGIHKYGKKKIKGIEQLETIEFNRDDAILSSKLELQCEKKGKIAARIDTMIASVTINRKAKLFTFNQKHFKIISGLTLLQYSFMAFKILFPVTFTFNTSDPTSFLLLRRYTKQ